MLSTSVASRKNDNFGSQNLFHDIDQTSPMPSRSFGQQPCFRSDPSLHWCDNYHCWTFVFETLKSLGSTKTTIVITQTIISDLGGRFWIMDELSSKAPRERDLFPMNDYSNDKASTAIKRRHSDLHYNAILAGKHSFCWLSSLSWTNSLCFTIRFRRINPFQHQSYDND
jgi:hypothetical protein